MNLHASKLLFYICFMSFTKIIYADSFLAISDIHLNPFSFCYSKDADEKKACKELIAELDRSSDTEWESVFERYYKDPNKVAVLGEDTTFPLFISILKELKFRHTKVNYKFVIITGDFLGHSFIERYEIFSGNHDKEKKDLFTKKTFKFMANAIRKYLPKDIQIYSTIGNNDSYIDNYNVDNPLTSSFYKELGESFSLLAKNIPILNFSKVGGYYSLSSPIKNLEIISLNTNIFSLIAKDKDGADLEKMRKEHLQWIDSALNEVKKNNKKALIISHIPVGIDAFMTTKIRIIPIPYWDIAEEKAATPYLALLNKYAPQIAGNVAGHSHKDSFQIVNKENKSFIVTTSAVSPIHRNNPSYKIYELAENNEIINSDTYIYNLYNKTNIWEHEYNFNSMYNSKSLYEGMLNLTTKWNSNPEEVDKLFAKYFMTNADASHVENDWDFFRCQASYVTAKEFKKCLSSKSEKHKH